MKKIDNMGMVTASVGDNDMFCVLCKLFDDAEGWTKTVMAHEVINVGCLVVVNTRQKNDDKTYSISEAVTFVPGVTIAGNSNGGNKLLVRTGTKLR